MRLVPFKHLIQSYLFIMHFFDSLFPVSLRHRRCPQQNSRDANKHTVTEGIDALRQIASTSLFMHNEQHKSLSNVPIIKEPDKPTGMYTNNTFTNCSIIHNTPILSHQILSQRDHTKCVKSPPTPASKSTKPPA